MRARHVAALLVLLCVRDAQAQTPTRERNRTVAVFGQVLFSFGLIVNSIAGIVVLSQSPGNEHKKSLAYVWNLNGMIFGGYMWAARSFRSTTKRAQAGSHP